MRSAVKALLSALFPVFRFINRTKVLVLAYHDIRDVASFERQLQLLNKYYKAISIFDFAEWVAGKRALPPNSVLITFDDGDPSVKALGLPLLLKYKFPAVAFVVSENIKSKKKYWWKVIEATFLRSNRSLADARKEVGRLKMMPNYERLKTLSELSASDPSFALQYDALTIEDLRALESGAVVIGSHTATHPILNNCTDRELENEFRESKEFFDQAGIKTYRYFAYPNGDYDDRAVPILKKYGVELAFTFDHRLTRKVENKFAVSRIRANAHDSLAEFRLRVCGISSLLNK
jgi:peptidoglycan/xylan/chitin deacetylase (PgdA/CDA1 family)